MLDHLSVPAQVASCETDELNIHVAGTVSRVYKRDRGDDVIRQGGERFVQLWHVRELPGLCKPAGAG